MTQPVPIRMDEWLAELDRLTKESNQRGDDGFALATEIAKSWNMSDNLARRRLRMLLESGRVELGSVKRVRINGIVDSRSAYRIKK